MWCMCTYMPTPVLVAACLFSTIKWLEVPYSLIWGVPKRKDWAATKALFIKSYSEEFNSQLLLLFLLWMSPTYLQTTSSMLLCNFPFDTKNCLKKIMISNENHNNPPKTHILKMPLSEVKLILLLCDMQRLHFSVNFLRNRMCVWIDRLHVSNRSISNPN